MTKRLLSIIMMLTMLVVSLPATAKSLDDLSSLQSLATLTYIQAKAPMLNKMNLYQYGVHPELTDKLKVLQIAIVPLENADKAREIVRNLVDNWENGLTMNGRNSYISVWGKDRKNDSYGEVVVGVGLPGRLVYIYMQGQISSENLTMLLMPYQ